eukprot:TRINITY_DN6041_c0_g1_i2.p1 TRINITY_DN6041_c0_g1~~TRINITY_DN6041_c0_g1_i2.p1  ORF type:complete len:216 (-),score=49.13 TRINITY_DN6041_c0_g1_i2:1045-1692(-)
MKAGEVAGGSIGPAYGFGREEYAGELATVPSNSLLEYEVELLAFEREKESWDLDDEEKLAMAVKKKEAGDACFHRQDYARAMRKYSKSAGLVEFDGAFSDEMKKKSVAVKLACNLNSAVAMLMLRDFNGAVQLASKVLQSHPGNASALHRRAMAYLGTHDKELALADVKAVLAQDGTDRAITKACEALLQRVTEGDASAESDLFAQLKLAGEGDS